jgi:exonuclease III
MKVMIWNIRGMGKKTRVRQLKEMILREDVDIVGVQETIKKNFFTTELEGLAPGKVSLGTG